MKRKKNLLTTIGINKLLPKISKPASSPGTVKYIGKKREAPVKVHIISYSEKEITDRQDIPLEEALDQINSNMVTWINISGVHDENIIKKAGEHLGIHPLVMEDIANTTHSAKFEAYDDYLFTIIKMATFQEDTKEVGMEQVSLLTGKNYVITLQEHEGDIFDGLRERIRLSKGKVRRMGSDYLMYGIIDAVVDHYFVVLGKIGEELEKMEEELITSANQSLLIRLYQMKRETAFLRKSIWPAREVVDTLIKIENTTITKNTRIFLRDVYDHIFQVVETLETFRDMASGMLELYLSITSNKMNEIMKVLTIFAAVFIPLTFIAGVYGMNFEFMPELHYKLAYPIWWAATITLGVGLLLYFRLKKWL